MGIRVVRFRANNADIVNVLCEVATSALRFSLMICSSLCLRHGNASAPSCFGSNGNMSIELSF